jgi:hypothetical protein
MSLVTPDTEIGTDVSTNAVRARGARSVGSRQYRVDLVGASALLIVGAGLVGTFLLLRPPSAVPTTPAAISPSTTQSGAARDRWYEETTAPAAITPPTAPSEAARDRWYDDPRETR